MPYYCTVPRCTSMAGKAKNVSFHQFPRDEELARLWNNVLKRGKPYTKYSKVCSLHFKPEDYTITSVGKNKGQWRTLRKDAVPSQNLPSETPAPYTRKQWGDWTRNSASPNVLDPTIQQQVAQAIYMQTMLAMQAAGPTESMHNGPTIPELPTPQTSTDADTKSKQTNEHTSYKCTECTKCFKDPDVFLLHKRSHTKDKNCIEKENFNMNVTLRSNPILANLLKTNNEANFDPNWITMESLLMTALAANIDYLRNYSVIKDCDRADLNLNLNNIGDISDSRGDRGGINDYRGDIDDSRVDRGDLNDSQSDSNNSRGDINDARGDRGIMYDAKGNLNSSRGDINYSRGDLNGSRGDLNSEGKPIENCIRVRDFKIPITNRDKDSNVNITNDVLNLEGSPNRECDLSRYLSPKCDLKETDANTSKEIDGFKGREFSYTGKYFRERYISTDDEDCEQNGEKYDQINCDNDLNESLDSNGLVIDESV